VSQNVNFQLNSQDIVALRPQTQRPDPGTAPLQIMSEEEAFNKSGERKRCLTVFLRGGECQFKCLMCDLWRHTHREPTPTGFIPAQIKVALATRVSKTGIEGIEQGRPQWIKLYNASNFFSAVNVPPEDDLQIASLLDGFERVIVENHPNVLNERVAAFARQIEGRLEVAMGLETAHEPTLRALNKKMTTADFREACSYLRELRIDVRTFALLRPPGMGESEGIEWCRRTVDFALENGVRHVTIIPVRAGNGSLEHLAKSGHFEPPMASSLETVLESHIDDSRGIITADTWDWELMRGKCAQCSNARRTRIESMNLTQSKLPPLSLSCRC
jgi:radical SAM enzyme (TIGR01210 family)